MWNKKRAGHVKGRHTFSLLSPSTFNVWSWVFWFTTKYFLWWVGVPTKGKPPQPPTTLDMSQLKKPLQTSSEFPATTLPTSHFLGDQQVKTTLLSHQAHGTSRDVPKATLRNTDILYLIYYILLYQFEKTHPKYDMHEYYYISCNTWIIGASWLMIPPPLNINLLSSGWTIPVFVYPISNRLLLPKIDMEMDNLPVDDELSLPNVRHFFHFQGFLGNENPVIISSTPCFPGHFW